MSGKNTEENMGLHIACWVTNAKTTHTKYVLIIAFPQQKRLQERAAILHYMYIHFYSCFIIVRTFISETISYT
jgi:hypothetical protein